MGVLMENYEQNLMCVCYAIVPKMFTENTPKLCNIPSISTYFNYYN